MYSPRGIFFFFGHNLSQELGRGQGTIYLDSGISTREENVSASIDKHEPVGPEAATVGKQHDVAPAQFFDDDGSDVEQIAISNCWCHAPPARSKSKSKSVGQQCPAEKPKELRMTFICSGRSQGSSPLHWDWGGSETDSKE
jgi:hypothetical protein